MINIYNKIYNNNDLNIKIYNIEQKFLNNLFTNYSNFDGFI